MALGGSNEVWVKSIKKTLKTRSVSDKVEATNARFLSVVVLIVLLIVSVIECLGE